MYLPYRRYPSSLAIERCEVAVLMNDIEKLENISDSLSSYCWRFGTEACKDMFMVGTTVCSFFEQ